MCSRIWVTIGSIDETLEKMGLDYLDQMIIHSPQPWNQFRVEKRYSEENKAVWRALEDAQSEGKVRVIGFGDGLCGLVIGLELRGHLAGDKKLLARNAAGAHALAHAALVAVGLRGIDEAVAELHGGADGLGGLIVVDEWCQGRAWGCSGRFRAYKFRLRSWKLPLITAYCTLRPRPARTTRSGSFCRGLQRRCG